MSGAQLRINPKPTSDSVNIFGSRDKARCNCGSHARIEQKDDEVELISVLVPQVLGEESVVGRVEDEIRPEWPLPQ
jgi:hypothetical protein